ncbi:MAG TPA: M56 family metallopeptidase [Xanthobacteraceae bacterium]|nr:M56 family metallopeptidase [Xanthobacteraceae bacterium]
MLALLLESALRLLALGGVVWLGLKLFRVRNPHAQMTAWTVVLLASLSMPVLMRFVTVTIPAGPPPPQLARIVSAAPSLPLEAILSLEAIHSPAGSARSAAAPSSRESGVTASGSDAISGAFDWREVIAGIYIVVAGVLLLRLLIGLVLTWRLTRRARPVSDRWAAGADVRVSDAVGMPVTFGSTILLPPECFEWSAGKRQAVLLHEGSHVAHGDFYVLLLAVLNRAVFWFSPLAWWQLARLADLAELISDDAAIEVVQDRPCYAGILLDVASNGQRVPAGLAMARSRTVPRRVERILAATAVPTRMGWRRRAMIAITLIPLVAVSAVTIARSTPTQPRSGMIVPAESPMQPVSFADAQAMPSAAPNRAAALDRYVGYYQLNPRAVFTITRTDEQLFAQLTGQRTLPLRPAGNGEYVYGSAALRMSFVSDGQGTMLVLRQHGQNLVSARVDEARAAAVESVFVRQIAEAPDRFREQSPAPGSRDAVLRGIEELQRGAPDYQRMSPPLADGMRRQLGELHTMLTALGAPEAIFFRGVGPGGYDIYGVKFANGFGEFRLLMGTDGTIEDVAFRPDGDDTPGGVAACSEEASLKPSPDKAPIRLLLFNDTGADINLVSVDADGQRTRRGTIGTDRSGSILSYVARPWIITDAAGTCLEIVWPGQRTRFLAVHPRQEGDQPDRAITMRRMPTAGSEEALHRYIDGLKRGQPNYDQMTSEVAGETRRNLLLHQAILAKLGPLRAMSFRGASPLGNDIYTVHFANGSAEWRVGLVKNGRIGRIALGPQY